MKHFLTLFILGIFLSGNSQTLTLTQAASEPHVGDSSYYYLLDSSAYPNILPVAVTGSNVLWNFTNLNVLQNSANSAYLSPSAVPSASAFAGTTMVQKQGALYNFYKSASSPTTQTEMLGSVSNSINITFTNSAVIAKYPITYGSSFSDNVAGAFTFSVNGTFTGTVSTVADGTGTLQLPGGVVFTNVLRLKSVQQLNLSLGIIPFGTAKQTVYNYFHASQKFPVLNITYSSVSLLGSSSPSVSAVVTANSKVVTVGLEELNIFEQSILTYPNPADDEITVNFRNPFGEKVTCLLFSDQGALVLEKDLRCADDMKEKLKTKDLPNGVYFLSISNGQDRLGRKLIVQHN